MSEHEIIALPPELSDADAERDRELRAELAKLHREYQDRCRSIIEQITKIQARYMPRVILVPKADSTDPATAVDLRPLKREPGATPEPPDPMVPVKYGFD